MKNYNCFWRRASVLYISWRSFTLFNVSKLYDSLDMSLYSGSWYVSWLWVLGVKFSWISVISEICYLYICVLKYFSYISGFLASIGECSTFWGVFLFMNFVSGFVWVLEFAMFGLGRNYYIECYGRGVFPIIFFFFVIGMCVAYYIGI